MLAIHVAPHSESLPRKTVITVSNSVAIDEQLPVGKGGRSDYELVGERRCKVILRRYEFVNKDFFSTKGHTYVVTAIVFSSLNLKLYHFVGEFLLVLQPSSVVGRVGVAPTVVPKRRPSSLELSIMGIAVSKGQSESCGGVDGGEKDDEEDGSNVLAGSSPLVILPIVVVEETLLNRFRSCFLSTCS